MLKWINNLILAVGTSHYLACTVRIIQTRNQPYEWAVLTLAGMLTLISGYTLIRRKGAVLYRNSGDILPLTLFGSCAVVIPLIIILRGG